MRRMWVTWGAMLALLAGGCDAIDLLEITQRDAKTRVRPEPPGEHCEFGGDAVESGLDRDRDGELDDAEVTATDYVCDAALPQVLTRARTEPHGANCTLGGQAVQSGLDQDGSGQLDDAEVSATEYVCATSVANVLLRVRPVSPGARCPLGGQVSHAGHDANGNGLLEDGEIAQEVYACNEPAPVVLRLRSLAAFTAPCDGDDSGGTVLEAGPDLDGDKALAMSEVEATHYFCGMELTDLKLRHQPEPAGPNCSRSGTRVDAFQDLDHDGEPDRNGVSGTVYVCQSTRVHDGDFAVTGAVDLVALEGVTHLRGELTISAPTLTDASLPSLAVIEGSLTVRGNASLRRLFMPALRFVGGTAAVLSNARLDALTLGTAPDTMVRVERSLLVEDNPMLPTLEGLAAVQPGDSISLRANNALVDPGLLPHVTELHGSLVITDHLRLDRSPFYNLTRVHGDVRLSGNTALGGPFGLNHLTQVGGSLDLQDNAVLETLDPLAQLTSVGALFITGNPRLTDTTGLEQLTSAGRIHIQGNKELLSVGDMPLLLQVTDSFSVKYNEKLQRVHHLPVLRSVATVALVGNTALTSLEGFQRLTRLTTLDVLGNAAVTNLGDLARLREVDYLNLQGNAALTDFGLTDLVRVPESFGVIDNARLPTCRATALAASVFQGQPWGLVIERNDDAATCP
ncbi:putative lipoprotein [Corallococcus coralloides DSM 2259]|uniref:Putative lipoprotein n=1 Tax=Corallococcus coralloides (strain ATCC 25202 / DSM 2259 / NBRC 100086 / M2) TaxID=1144275 RepID=H8MK92_CORCM|nr:leucine-rich repeat domain-containing protein [Corallococcus coralloides]AFE03786.1 putative lipoprotein [Corallococcus coralloides DSM 2259]